MRPRPLRLRRALSLPARHPAATLLLAAAFTVLAVGGAMGVRAEVDFTSTVPPGPGVEAYREMLGSLDGLRFGVVHMPYDPASRLGSLRADDGFDALVREQENLTATVLEQLPPGSVSHTLSAYEAMRQGNYMLAKIATAGRPPASAYALPQDPASWQAVRQQVRDGGSADDVLAEDGSSALVLVFFETRDAAEARRLAGQLEGVVAAWSADADAHPATKGHATTGLLAAAHYVDEVNRAETQRWTLVASAGVLVALALVLRGPVNAAIAVASLGAALAWTYGAMGLLDVRISFLTLFLAPIVIGVGVDYAVHVLQRHEEERDRGLGRRAAAERALETTGAPVAIAAATTIAGLATLLFVPAPLFAEIGGMGALGVGLGVLAALTIVPAARALLPDLRPRRPAPRRDRLGDALARLSTWIARRRQGVAVGLAALLALAGVVAWQGTRVAANSVDDELPADDPVAQLQRRIEDEYGAFERAYLVVRGDVTDPRVLRALLEAAEDARDARLVRSSASVVDLLLADDATDQGAADLTLGGALAAAGRAPADESRLPRTQEEARERLDRLFADPLWRTLAPFTVSADYRLAVVALTLDPWEGPDELHALAADLEAQAQRLREALPPGADAQAAGAPINRARVLDQTPRDVAIATVGSAAAVLGVLGLVWLPRRREGARLALAAVVVVGGACALLLASIPLLDLGYQALADAGVGPGNRAYLSEILLLAFALTVASGVDDVVVLAHRWWEARAEGATADEARERAFRLAGRAISGTTLVNVVAFALLSGAYFLQSKNLAVLAALGIAYAYLLTLAVAPLALGPAAREDPASP